MQQVYLKPDTLSILVGACPSREQFEMLAPGFGETRFKQVVFVSSRNLVQLCNFVKRCRTEGARNKYLVILQFHPEVNSWHLMDSYKQLNVTLIVCGGPCLSYAVRDVFHYAAYILEWTSRAEFGRRPIIGVCKVQSHRLGVLRIFDTLSAPDGGDASISRAYDRWVASADPLTRYTSESAFFRPTTAASQTTRDPFSTSSSSSSSTSGVLTVRAACGKLGITEDQAKSADAIKRAYRTLAMQWHPDKRQSDSAEEIAVAAAKFTDISEANIFLLGLIAPGSTS